MTHILPLHPPAFARLPEAFYSRVSPEPLHAPYWVAQNHVLAAEVEYALRHEWALNTEDVARRTGMHVGSCRQGGCLERLDKLVSDLSASQQNKTSDHVPSNETR